MRSEVKEVVQQVLREASDHDNFSGWTFTERLNWMIARGWELGAMHSHASLERERFAAIEASLESIKGALGRGIGAVLLNVTDLPDEQIKQWVFKSMLRPTETPDGSKN